jgi:hypothetical protein
MQKLLFSLRKASWILTVKKEPASQPVLLMEGGFVRVLDAIVYKLNSLYFSL